MNSSSQVITPSHPPFSIRLCGRADMDEIVEIENACFDTGILPILSLIQYYELFPSTFFVAILEDKCCGFAIAGISAETPYEAWVLDLAVKPSVQALGIGSALITVLSARLKELGVASIRATVAPTNKRSFRLCKRAGFVVEGTDATYFGPSEPRLLLRLTWSATETVSD